MTKTDREQILLLQQEQKFMNEKIDKNHEEVMNAIGKIENFLEKLPDSFATKMEHRSNKESIDRLWKIVWAVIGFVFVGIGGAVLALILK